MAMILKCVIDLDSLAWRDQAKALNAMAELEDLGRKHKIKFDYSAEQIDVPPVAAVQPATAVEPAKKETPKLNGKISMGEGIPLDSAETKILRALGEMKRGTFRQIQEATELITGTLSPNLSRMVLAGKIEKHSPAGATRRTPRDQIDYSLPKR